MLDVLRPLLVGVIDYAGTFPPAALPLREAVAHLRRYRLEQESWLLGRSVHAAARLDELAKFDWNPADGRLSALVPAGQTETDLILQVIAAQAAIDAFPQASLVDCLELLWPANCVDRDEEFRDVVTHVAGELTRAATLFFEFAAPDPDDDRFGRQLRAAVGGLAKFNAKGLPVQAGFKIRTGGATAAAVPSAARLATVITACRDAKVFWKATGGLHHPWRHRVEKTWSHGFLNVSIAAALAATRGISTETVEAILVDHDPGHFRFDDAAIAWGDSSVTAPQIAAARFEAFRSFGSCSFDEPREDLKALGWL